MAGQSGWVIPAISAGASLIGTLVGGLSTYWTSKKSFERSLTSEQSAQRNNQLRDAAIRFVAAVADRPVVQSGLIRMAEEWGPLTGRLAAAETDRDFLELARTIDQSIPAGATREEALVGLMRSTGFFEEDFHRAVSLITELRLIAPADVAESAQKVIYSAATRELVAVTSPQRLRLATDSFNGEVNDFFNRVRRHMNVEDIDFDFFNEAVMQRILKL